MVLMRLVQILHPQAKRNSQGTFSLGDYRQVPRLETFGTWRMVDLLKDQQTMLDLLRLRSALGGK